MDKLLNKIEKTETCWNWVGEINDKGYGRIDVSGKHKRAHRLVYEYLVGKIPLGLQLDHLCRNRRCVNPKHLEPVTRKENILRGFAPSAICARRQHCSKGHPYSGENLYIKHVKGYSYRRCRECHKAECKKYTQRRKLLAQLPCFREDY